MVRSLDSQCVMHSPLPCAFSSYFLYVTLWVFLCSIYTTISYVSLFLYELLSCIDEIRKLNLLALYQYNAFSASIYVCSLLFSLRNFGSFKFHLYQNLCLHLFILSLPKEMCENWQLCSVYKLLFLVAFVDACSIELY